MKSEFHTSTRPLAKKTKELREETLSTLETLTKAKDSIGSASGMILLYEALNR